MYCSVSLTRNEIETRERRKFSFFETFNLCKYFIEYGTILRKYVLTDCTLENVIIFLRIFQTKGLSNINWTGTLQVQYCKWAAELVLQFWSCTLAFSFKRWASFLDCSRLMYNMPMFIQSPRRTVRALSVN